MIPSLSLSSIPIPSPPATTFPWRAQHRAWGTPALWLLERQCYDYHFFSCPPWRMVSLCFQCWMWVPSHTPWYQRFLANLPIEIRANQPNGKSSVSSSLIHVFFSHPLSTLTIRQGVNTCQLSPPHSARGRKLQNWQEGYPGLLESETNILLLFTKDKLF